MLDSIHLYGNEYLGGAWLTVWTLVKIVVVVAPLMLCVAYLTLWERKAIGWTQIRPARTAWARSGCCSRSPTR